VDGVTPAGGTAIYDAVARALPIAAEGQHRKKAILVISDGNDTNSETSVATVRNMIRESDVLVYALGVDGNSRVDSSGNPPPRSGRPSRSPDPGAGGASRRPGIRRPADAERRRTGERRCAAADDRRHRRDAPRSSADSGSRRRHRAAGR
jgi:hypothetical protein